MRQFREAKGFRSLGSVVGTTVPETALAIRFANLADQIGKLRTEFPGDIIDILNCAPVGADDSVANASFYKIPVAVVRLILL